MGTDLFHADRQTDGEVGSHARAVSNCFANEPNEGQKFSFTRLEYQVIIGLVRRNYRVWLCAVRRKVSGEPNICLIDETRQHLPDTVPSYYKLKYCGKTNLHFNPSVL